jgi:dihydroneopterin aldolase
MEGTIIIKGLQYLVKIGLTERERKFQQPIAIDLKITLYMDKVIKTQAIQDTVDYTVVQEGIAHFLQEKEYLLLEKLTNEVVDHLLLTFPKIDQIICRVWKPHAVAQKQAENVGVEIRKKQMVRETEFSY